MIKARLMMFIMLVGPSAMAQAAPPYKEMLRAENQYYIQTIIPQVRAVRRKLEPYLSAADKQQLVNYWAQVRGIVTTSRLHYNSLPTSPSLGFVQGGEQRLHQGAALTKQLEPLLVRYNQPIRQLLQELEPQQKQWKTTLRALHQPATKSATSSLSLNADGTLLLEQILTPFGLLTLNPDEPSGGANGSKHNK